MSVFECAECGLPSRRDELFRKYWPAPTEAPERFCPPCWEEREARTQRHGLEFAVVVLGILLVGFAIVPVGHETRVARLGLWVVGIYAAATILHELGHAGVARLLGQPVRAISLGMGRLTYSRRIGGVDWQLRSFPIGGFVQFVPGGRFARLKSAAVSAAGPLVNAALVVLGLTLGAELPWSDLSLPEVHPVHLLVGVNAVIVAINGLPLPMPTSNPFMGDPDRGEIDFQPNDGLSFLQSLFAPRETVAAWDARARLAETRDLVAAGRREEALARLRTAEEPAAPVARVAWALALHAAGAEEDAVERLRALSDAELPAPVRRHVLVAAADVALAGRADPAGPAGGPPRPDDEPTSAELAEAQRVAQALADVAPGTLDERWVQGRLAVAKGRFGEGLTRLEEVLAATGGAPEVQAAAAAWLSRAHEGRGHARAAEAFADLARRLAPAPEPEPDEGTPVG